MAFSTIISPMTVPAAAASSGGDRTIWLHHTHTGQTAKFTFKRNGVYDQAVLRQMNAFLADWRTKDQTNMEPALFDLLWEVYQDVGGTQPYNIVSSYRAPKTNAMLRANSSGVAENSQHIRGKAMDVFIPGVNLSKLREAAMRHQVGGVGFYPTSGSPFVHMDTGNVRAWPRMTRTQLAKVFPDGKTLHLPVDGKPLSDKGRSFAMNEWQKCHTVPCTGQRYVAPDQAIMVAEAAPAPDAPIPAKRIGRGAASGEVLMASVEEPAQRVVETIAIDAPIPLRRPARLLSVGAAPKVAAPIVVAEIAPSATDKAAWLAAGSPFPASKPQRLVVATRDLTTGSIGKPGQTALAALNSLDYAVPKPRDPISDTSGEMVTAYAPSRGAEVTLQGLIAGDTTTASLPMKAPLGLDGQPAAAPRTDLAALGTMVAGTFDAVGSSTDADMLAALAQLAQSRGADVTLTARVVDFVAPEIDHVNETLVEPQLMTASFWADMTEAEGYLEKTTELGPLTARVGFVAADSAIPAYDRFVSSAPMLGAGL